MPASYLPWTQGQPYLLPPSPDDWLPQGHLARFVVDLVDQLDLTDIYARIEAGRAPQGRPAYPPRLMVALLLYAYMTGTPSSRAIQRKCHEDIGYRFLCGNLQPDFRTIARFRKEHLACLPDLFVQSVTLCVAAGLVDMDLVAVDGTRMLANASKRKAMSYGRMKKEEGKLRRRIEELLQQAEATDAAEDEAMGDDDGMPQVREELRDARARRAFIAEQMRVLEAESRSDRAAELREFAEGNERRATELEATGDSRGEARRKRTNARKQREKADDLDDDPPPPAAPTDLPSSRHATTPGGAPKSRVQRNFTDPDSRIMKHDGAFIQAYNAQAAVDDKRQVIVAQGVSSVAADTFHLQPMVRRVIATVGRMASVLVADGGYWAPENATLPHHPEIEVYIAPDRTPHGPAPPLVQAEPDEDATSKERMRVKAYSERGRQLMIRRRTTVEPVFGHIKEARSFRRFSMRGLDAVRGEWALVAACHNFLKLFTHGPQPQPA